MTEVNKIINSPLVSVIVTSFNQSKTIEQALDSILSQKCNFPFEIIIGDDFSTDKSQIICKKYQQNYPNIFPIFQQENVGVAANFALSVMHAKGKYIAVCAGDDFWHNPDKMQMQVDFLENHPDYGLIYSDYDKFNIKNNKILKNFLATSHKKIYQGAGLIGLFFDGKVPALTVTVMFRKELFDKYVPANDYIKYRFTIEDWPTWLILSKYSKIKYLPVSTGTYRYGHESISNPLDYEKIIIRYEKEHFMYKYLCNYLPDDLQYSEPRFLIQENKILLNLAYKKFDYRNAKKFSRKMVKLGSKDLKVHFAQFWATFMFFAYMKYIRQQLNYRLYFLY